MANLNFNKVNLKQKSTNDRTKIHQATFLKSVELILDIYIEIQTKIQKPSDS